MSVCLPLSHSLSECVCDCACILMPAKQHAAAVDAFAKVKLAKGSPTISPSTKSKNNALAMSRACWRGWRGYCGGIENDRNPNK